MSTTISLDDNLVVDEDAGVVWLPVTRSGDLSEYTTVLIAEDWGRSSTTAEEDDLWFNYHAAGSDVQFLDSSKSVMATFASGVDEVFIPYTIYDDDKKENFEKLYFNLVGVPTGTNIDDEDAYIKIRESDQPIELRIGNAGTVNEGGYAVFDISLNDELSEEVNFWVSTYYDSASSAAGDYRGIVDELHTIPAGVDSVTIGVETFSDDVYDEGTERFYLRIDSASGAGVEIVDNSGTAYINDTTPVPQPEPEPEEPAITADMLSEHAQLFSDLENEMGSETAASVIGGKKDLSEVGKTLDLLGLLSSSIKNAVTWFAGSVAYASEEDILDIGLTENQINMGLRLQSRVDADQVATDPVYWTSSEVESTNWLGLRVGDFVDGRLVIHQPWLAFEDDGSYESSNSVQGRYTPDDPSMFSHTNNFKNSFDWSANDNKYLIAPADGTVVDSQYTLSSDEGVYGVGNLGNFVTMLLDEKTKDGDPIYITFAHLKQEDRQLFKVDEKVVTGQVIGMEGDTGGYLSNDEFVHYPKHTHITVGTDDRVSPGDEGVEGNIADSVDTIPPVYILGFNDTNVGSFSELGITGAGTQDYGFPMGDYDSNYGDTALVASDIYPTISTDDTNEMNDFVSLDQEVTIIDYGDQGIFARFRVRLYDDSALDSEITLDTTTENIVKWTVADLKFTTMKATSDGNTFDYVGGVGIRGDEFGDPLYFDTASGEVYVELLDYENNWQAQTDKYMGLIIESANGYIIRQNGTNYSQTVYTEEPYGTGGGGYTDDSDGDTSGGGNSSSGSSSSEPTLNGTAGDDVFVATNGDETINGGDGFDEIQFTGTDSKLDGFTFALKSDGGILVSSDTFGTKTIYDVEGAWFEGSNHWILTDDLPSLAPATTGTWGDDVFDLSSGDKVVFGLTGFDEVQYRGLASKSENFTFSRESADVVVASSEAFGIHTLHGIEAVYFDYTGEWKLIDDLITEVTNGTNSDDVFVATNGDKIINGGDGFDELQFYGLSASSDQFTFTELPDGGVDIYSEAFGSNTIHDVEALYFDYSGEWGLIDNYLS